MKTKKLISALLALAVTSQFSAAFAAETRQLITGDVDGNGVVDITDLTQISLAVVGDITLSDEQVTAADINRNGEADLADLARLRQYVSKVILYDDIVDSSAVSEEPLEISDFRISSADFEILKTETPVIESEEELKERIENARYFPESYKTYEGWLQYNKADIDFENEILIVVSDTNACNGEKQTVRKLTVDSEGGIVVYIDDMKPSFQTALGSMNCIFIAVPRAQLPEGKKITAREEKNVFGDMMDITDECKSYDYVSSLYDEEIYFNQPLNNVIDSVEKFSKLNRVVYDDGGSEIRLYDAVTESGDIDISDEFFTDNILLVSTLIEGAGAENHSSLVTLNNRGAVRWIVKRTPVSGPVTTDIKTWTLVTVVPRSAIERAENIYGIKYDMTLFEGKIYNCKADDDVPFYVFD